MAKFPFYGLALLLCLIGFTAANPIAPTVKAVARSIENSASKPRCKFHAMVYQSCEGGNSPNTYMTISGMSNGYNGNQERLDGLIWTLPFEGETLKWWWSKDHVVFQYGSGVFPSGWTWTSFDSKTIPGSCNAGDWTSGPLNCEMNHNAGRTFDMDCNFAYNPH
ncbi:hypothetical protein BCR34DRAFT_595525 [Clohesyomyces aquaticus]|uniref:C-type lectin domain-containing protein n=1 Tax=Clohesyomyces aquaticus TaxID=1231657 RepID=A0A1Y2ABB7_9PLEO|nr:hypothetical protein BCR34DRAFT_595525 [Clohesyomyces aquaticus]